MNLSPNPCPPEILDFCSRELGAIREQIDQTLDHLAAGETLAALGASDGLAKRTTFIGNVLHLIARLYPNSSPSQRSLPLQQ